MSAHTKEQGKNNGRQGNLNYMLSPVSHAHHRSAIPCFVYRHKKLTSIHTLVHMDEGSRRGSGGQGNHSLPEEGSSYHTITSAQLCQESLSPMGWGTSTHCVNGEALWSALQTEVIAACMGMGHIMGCKGRTFWDCIRPCELFGAEPNVWKGGDQGGLRRNKCGRIEC